MAADALRTPVAYVPVPVPAMIETMAGFGLDAFTPTMMGDHFVAGSRGWHADVTTAVEELTGRPGRPLADSLRDVAGAFAAR
jgi:uncharacterized protein YbjT (DUF2867 family)